MFKLSYDGKMDKEALKEVFPKVMKELLIKDKDVVYLDADLMNSFGTGNFPKEFPERAIDVGVQEANMIGMAAGMSAEGKKPYVHSFGPFVSRRVYDQVFLSVAYAKNSVRILGSDPGVTAAYNGGTHMPFEDVALYRAIPEAAIFDIVDTTQFKEVLNITKDRSGVTYIRTPRKSVKKVYSDDSKFEIGKANVLIKGEDVTIIASGIMVAEALEAAKILKEENIKATVIDIVTIKPIDEETIIEYAKETGAMISAENANVIGGLGDAVASVLSCHSPTPLEKVGVQDEFGEVGTESYLRERFNLTSSEIIKKVKCVIERKTT